MIDIHALENRQQNAQFFVAEVAGESSVAPDEGGGTLAHPDRAQRSHGVPLRRGPASDRTRLQTGCRGLLYSLSFASAAANLQIPSWRNRGADVERRCRSRVARPVAITEPVDSLERTLKPLQPHLFDVYTPEQFRKALSNLLDEISRL